MRLTTRDNRNVRAINQAIVEYGMGGGSFPVYATLESQQEHVVRISRARMHKGQLQGFVLVSGKWENIIETVQ